MTRSWLPLPPEVLPVLEVLAIVSLVMVLAGIVLVPIFVARIPARYYVDPPRPVSDWGQRHPLQRWTLRVSRNVLGWILVVAGVAMLALPGQGLLSIIAGLSLLDLPHKRDMELWIVRRGPVFRSLSWIRKKTGKAPLELPKD